MQIQDKYLNSAFGRLLHNALIHPHFAYERAS